MATVNEILVRAQQAWHAGNVELSERICREIVAQAADFGPAWHLLGTIAHARGQQELTANCHATATRLMPESAEAHYDLGHALHVLNRLDDAAVSYARALELSPGNFAVLANLGAVRQQQGKLAEAEACYREALAQRPEFAEVLTNLGMVLKDQGKLDEALAACRRAVELSPNFAAAHSNLGAALQAHGQLEEAVASYLRSLALEASYDAYFNLATAYRQLGQLDDAIRCYRHVLSLQPVHAEAYNNLGVAFKDQGKLHEARAAYEQALAIRPQYAEAHNNLGAVFQELGDLERSIGCYRRALGCKPNFAEALGNLSIAFHDQDQLDAATAALQQALAVQPDYAHAHLYLGNVLKDQSRLEEAVASFRRALDKDSDLAVAHSNLLFAMQYCPSYDAAEIAAEHERWNKRHALPLTRQQPTYANDRSPDRRLKVGYVSPDFRNHCQALFTTPLFSNHDHTQFEIVCYSDVLTPDIFTQRLQTYADEWRDISGLNEAKTADRIREDRVDVLVDLTMHMKRNHSLVFARKPAPVQVCWLAYPGTTGQTAIDYRLTDPYLDPPGLFDRFYSEQTIRLPDTFWCYDPLASEPAVNELPAQANGYITFGSLNNFCKLNDGTLALWARVMNAVERSRLIVFVSEGSHRQRTQDFFVREGISADRITFVTRQPRRKYLEQYQQIDIGLDTFPYNGHTTSLDAFWMGVPVVTLVGHTVVGRAGFSQLTNLGLPELIANTTDEYVAIVAALSRDLPRLSHLRSTLRRRMEQSPLMDAPRFAKHIEAAYRHMWHRWCAQSA
jgi:protein O-GlcNAc transferase